MDALLVRLAETVTQARDLEGLARPLLKLLETVTGLESTYMTRIDLTAGQQHIMFSHNSKTIQIPEGLSVPWGDTLCKRALEENRPYTDDVPAGWGDSRTARELGIQTYLSQPVHYADGRLYGTLCAASSARRAVSPQALEVLGMFAKILGLQVERERQLEEMAARAMSDALTGIPNRRALNEALVRALARAKREGGSVQVAFIDLDGFKLINDRYGHETGDRLLQEVARRLAKTTRAAEFAGRYGGDEFVLVAEGARPEETRLRLEQAIAGPYELGQVRLDYAGASVGVVTATPDDTVEQLLQRADAAMYAAKTARKAASA